MEKEKEHWAGRTQAAIVQASMSSKPWSGETELQAALQELCGQHPVPASKIRQAVTVANKYCAEFKMVVYEIEKFVKRVPVDDKIAGIFVMDSLCRQHSKERETFAKRFAVRLKDTLGQLAKIGPKDRATLQRFVEEWRKRDIFPSSALQSFGHSSASAEASASTTASAHSSLMSEGSADAAALLAATEGSELRPAAKICPFKDGCPFGDKCRFSHFDTNTLDQYAARATIAFHSSAESSSSSNKRRRTEMTAEMTSSLNRILDAEYQLPQHVAPLATFRRTQVEADCIAPKKVDIQCFEVAYDDFLSLQPCVPLR